MSMLDIIAEYNRRVEEEKKLLDKRKFREKVISNLEEKLNFKIECPGIKEIEKEMKEGARVRIRRDSEFADQNENTAIIKGIPKGMDFAILKFGDNTWSVFDIKDLELIYREEKNKEKNKEIIDEFYKQPFNLFKEYLKQQVEEISPNKNFKAEDEIIMNAEANKDFRYLKMGSKGKIIKDHKDGTFLVRFTEITGGEPLGKNFIINKKYMEYIIPKGDSEKLVQDSIEFVKKKYEK